LNYFENNKIKELLKQKISSSFFIALKYVIKNNSIDFIMKKREEK